MRLSFCLALSLSLSSACFLSGYDAPDAGKDAGRREPVPELDAKVSVRGDAATDAGEDASGLDTDDGGDAGRSDDDAAVDVDAGCVGASCPIRQERSCPPGVADCTLDCRGGSGACNANCSGAVTCEVLCGRDCYIDCGSAASCAATCPADGSCTFICTDAGDCRPRCEADSVCDVLCGKGGKCDQVVCEDGASCSLQCAAADDPMCQFTNDCAAPVPCPTDSTVGNLVCGRACPGT